MKDRILGLEDIPSQLAEIEKGDYSACYKVFEILLETNPIINYNPVETIINGRNAIIFGLEQDYKNETFIESHFKDFLKSVKEKHICVAYQGNGYCMLNTDALYCLYKI